MHLTKLNFYKSLHKSVSLLSCFHSSLRMRELARRQYNIDRAVLRATTDSTFYNLFTANRTTSFSDASRLKGLIYLQFVTTEAWAMTFSRVKLVILSAVKTVLSSDSAAGHCMVSEKLISAFCIHVHEINETQWFKSVA